MYSFVNLGAIKKKSYPNVEKNLASVLKRILFKCCVFANFLSNHSASPKKKSKMRFAFRPRVSGSKAIYQLSWLVIRGDLFGCIIRELLRVHCTYSRFSSPIWTGWLECYCKQIGLGLIQPVNQYKIVEYHKCVQKS